jgi:flavin reductase (DIM6/NTAB) family NADH-FMN oxidoreductase RutF
MTMRRAEPHSMQVKAAFNNFPAAVGAVCAVVGGVPRGLVASSIAVGVSYDPPMVLFSVQKDSATWPHLRQAAHIGVSILSEGQSDICRKLAGPRHERFSEVATHRTEQGSLFVLDAISWLDCSIASVAEAGDHEVVLFRVEAVSVAEATNPLIFHRTRFCSPAIPGS